MENALGTFGRFNAYSGVIVTSLIASSLIPVGAYLLKTPDAFPNSNTFTVISAQSCTQTCTNNNCNQRVCPIEVQTPTGNTTVSFTNTQLPGSKVKVYYDNNTPPNYSPTRSTFPKWVPYGLIIVPIIFLIISIIFAYVISSSPTAAKIYGGVAGIHMLTGR